MTTVYLIRHAEAEGNLYRRAQGQFNSNITALGLRQVAALAERFRDVQLDAVWSSDLNRTMSTASAVLKYHPQLQLHTTPALREIDIGPWENCHWGNLDEDYPRQMKNFSQRPDKWHVPGGESFAAVQKRVVGELLRLGRDYDGGTIAVFAHGVVVRTALAYAMNIAIANLYEVGYGDNTAVAKLHIEGDRMQIEYANDSSHLGDLSTFARQDSRPVPGGGKRFPSLHPLNPEKDEELYEHCYSSTWLCSHGNLKGYTPGLYLNTAQMHARFAPEMVMAIYVNDEFAGIIDLDPYHGSDIGCGWISLLYVEPAFRGHRLGIQLIGHAVSVFRRAGRRTLRLSVSSENPSAIGFYERYGFHIIDTVPGAGAPLHYMETDITQRLITLP